jgi:hypothetical protein
VVLTVFQTESDVAKARLGVGQGLPRTILDRTRYKSSRLIRADAPGQEDE